MTVDYNSWIESEKGLKLASTLDKDVVLAEGYKEYDTGRTYLVKLGDWRKNKDEEVELDGIGGVNVIVKADVHRSGKLQWMSGRLSVSNILLHRHKLPMLCIRESSRNRRFCKDG